MTELAVLVELLAMVGDEDDQRVVLEVASGEFLQEFAERAIGRGDLGLVEPTQFLHVTSAAPAARGVDPGEIALGARDRAHVGGIALA